MKYDFHMHSAISKDSDTSLMTMAMAIREQDFDGVCFTEHLDPYFPDEFEPFFIDWQTYRSQISMARNMFPEMDIYMGIEAGLHPNSYEEINKQIEENSVDFVLGSMHCTEDMTIGEFDYYDRYEKKKIQEDYMKCLIKNIRDFDNFDSVAHIGFLSKFAPDGGFEIHYDEFSDYVDELLKIVIQKGKGIEVNASGLKNSQFTLPAKDILSRYKELGGEIITMGSDAHSPEYVGFEYDYVCAMVKHCGFEAAALYSNRKPKFYEL